MEEADVVQARLALSRRQEMAGFSTIVLLAVDNSEPSEYAFNWYRDYIHRAENYVVLLHCTDHNNQDFRDASPGRTKAMLKELTEKMKAIEEKFGQWMQLAGIHGKIRKGSGKPGEAIVKAAAEEGACMIVTGTRGHGKIKRAFLGSVSDYVVHHAPVPVIICRSKA
ncbi:putative universal stress protein SH1215 [Gigantopelta aegis]|uniref:putative universal stress protein SH1215 n=1 Tax=Gigantopelta aegis TaxID=1735272 RepID=UPI001B88B1E5|nr:putative universal stress protein SH1215 [Gigantopelta aegis]